MKSDLRAFIVDVRLVDVRLIDEVLRKLGVSHILLKQQVGNVVVYSFNRQSLSRRCLYERCATLDPVAREGCVEECVLEVEKTLSEAVAQEVKSFLSRKEG
ncbi:MAG: hypothetical protein QXN05_05785 [Acidilobaceae archaeon]